MTIKCPSSEDVIARQRHQTTRPWVFFVRLTTERFHSRILLARLIVVVQKLSLVPGWSLREVKLALISSSKIKPSFSPHNSTRQNFLARP